MIVITKNNHEAFILMNLMSKVGSNEKALFRN